MSDTYDLLCRVAMGLPMSAEDLAELGQQKLIVTEVKTILTPEGRATLKAIEADRDATMAPKQMDVGALRALLKRFPDIWSSHGILIGREELHALTVWRRDGYVEVGSMAHVTEWPDSQESMRLPLPDMRARLSKRAYTLWEKMGGARDGTIEERPAA